MPQKNNTLTTAKEWRQQFLYLSKYLVDLKHLLIVLVFFTMHLFGSKYTFTNFFETKLILNLFIYLFILICLLRFCYSLGVFLSTPFPFDVKKILSIVSQSGWSHMHV